MGNRGRRDAEMSRNHLFSFFILAIIGITFVQGIVVHPDVQFSFGCTQPLPSNCSGNWYFKNQLNFTNIKLYQNVSYYNDIGICLSPPFFKNVFDYPDIFDYLCDCTSNWVYAPTPCNATDTLTIHYIDSNMCYNPTNPPIDEGQPGTCNYCSSDIIPIYGLCGEDSTQSVSYVDLNKAVCCDETNLETDCDIYTFPYNETSTQSCNAIVANLGNFTCNPNPEIANNDKQPCQAIIPDQYVDMAYKCNSYVINTETNEIVQVNPDSSAGNQESRRYFTPVHSKIDFYYTGKNLKPDSEYMVKIECSSPDKVVYSQQLIQRHYESLSWVSGRLIWVKNNMSNLVGGVLVAILVVGVLAFIIKKMGSN